jgi:hypothetical protein
VGDIPLDSLKDMLAFAQPNAFSAIRTNNAGAPQAFRLHPTLKRIFCNILHLRPLLFPVCQQSYVTARSLSPK